MRILISGHTGFLGKHLLRVLKTSNLDLKTNFLEKNDFKDPAVLGSKILKNDIIFHFAGVNRDINEKEVFDKNNLINESLLKALRDSSFNGKLIFSSSIQEKSGTLYGEAKRDARIKFLNLSKELNFKFYGLLLPNIFGPFCKPFYNSFISTFSFEIISNKIPKIKDDKEISLMYVGDLMDNLIKIISDSEINFKESIYIKKVSTVLSKLSNFNDEYIKKGIMPDINSHFDLCLFNTFRSYINYQEFFPRKYNNFTDDRGSFTELIRFSSRGQSSFSITNKNIIRGNHFHTRKIERFSVIKGKAIIKLREVLSNDVIELYFDGETPSYIDIPIWYTHSLSNIGKEELITCFWINEHYDDETSDTYIENV